MDSCCLYRTRRLHTAHVTMATETPTSETLYANDTLPRRSATARHYAGITETREFFFFQEGKMCCVCPGIRNLKYLTHTHTPRLLYQSNLTTPEPFKPQDSELKSSELFGSGCGRTEDVSVHDRAPA